VWSGAIADFNFGFGLYPSPPKEFQMDTEPLKLNWIASPGPAGDTGTAGGGGHDVSSVVVFFSLI